MQTNTEYKKLIDKHNPKSKLLKNCFFAFLIGGFICFVGQWMFYGYYALFGTEREAVGFVSITLIFISALLTSLGIYDKIASIANAGTLVPITGFANSVVSPILDTKSEGRIIGVGQSIFSVAGPIILYSIIVGALYGVFYYIYLLIGGHI